MRAYADDRKGRCYCEGSSFGRIGEMTRLIQALFFVAVLLAWAAATAGGRINQILLPSPGIVLVQLARVLRSPTLLGDVAVTFSTFAIAFIIAIIAGIAIGYFISSSSFLIKVYEPLLAGIFAIPLIVFFPTFILFFGIGVRSKIALGATYAFFPIVLNTIAGFSSVSPALRRCAVSMGASSTQILRRVLLPGALPIVLTGVRIALIGCFASVIAGEMISSEHGLGHDIALASQSMEIARMFAYVFLVILIAFIFNLSLGALERNRDA